VSAHDADDDGVDVAEGCHRGVESALGFRLVARVGGDRDAGDLGGELFRQFRVEVDDRHSRADCLQCVRGVAAEALAGTDHDGPRPSSRPSAAKSGTDSTKSTISEDP
jgi:hypothetical protein